jgi:hypothetical protein
MRDLEQQLQALATEVEWPETPALAPALPAAPTSRRRRRLVVALAALALAAAVAAAVPGARSAILDWFRIGGVEVERVETLPSTVSGSLAEGLGTRIGAAMGARLLGGPFLVPAGVTRPSLSARGPVVSTLLATPSGPVLLSELRAGEQVFLLKKLVAQATVEFLEVGPGSPGAWIAGADHVVIVRSAPPRLAGNALIWESDGITFRLEGRRLTRASALAIARSITTG